MQILHAVSLKVMSRRQTFFFVGTINYFGQINFYIYNIQIAAGKISSKIKNHFTHILVKCVPGTKFKICVRTDLADFRELGLMTCVQNN